MKTIELVQLAKAGNTEAFGDVPDKRAAALVNAVLAELGRQLRESQEPVVVAGFGRFIVRNDTVTKDGQEVPRRRIGFRPAATRDAAPAAGAGKVGNAGQAAAKAPKAGNAGKAGKAGGAGAARKAAGRKPAKKAP